ncbi:unnamed protein product [Linum tenue]|uniref:Malate dehydrogenase n=1 Tax=Linum tenue TaxID=586396 RepID=A0AAV0M721_9ROSI|nr:unnamed protein product [Linum tenue]
MELEDSLFPLLREVNIGIDAYEVFQDAEWALLIGAKPRGPGIERADLLDINGQIFAEQGKALNAVASPNVKVMVVGNPCNTNALICLKNAPKIPAKNFHALTRLDENRAKCQLALKAGVFYDKVSNVTIWGNHSTTQVPDFLNAKIDGMPVKEVIKDDKWLEHEFTEKVQKRGGALIQKWGRSSAASTAVSIVDAIKSLVTPTPEGDWFSSGVSSAFLIAANLNSGNLFLSCLGEGGEKWLSHHFTMYTAGLHKWKSLWYSRRHSFQHAMQIKGRW